MKNIKNKKSIFIIIFLLVISSTVAYLYSSDTFQNIFVAASYKVTVTETFESPDNWKPGDTTPKTATLKNEGTVPIKVRVKLEEEWKDSNGEDLPLIHDGENVVIINFANEDDYIYKDGYYYYDLPLNPGETTSSIIESVTFNPNYSGTVNCIENDDSTHTCSSSEDGYDGGTYKLSLTIEGVQEDYYVQAWGLPGVIERQYLYDVLKNESDNNGLARKYTGEHHDSFTEEPSKDIYHWYASDFKDGPQIFNKNNVIFGDYCWHMIRTTDTGGVKMVYNGLVDNNQCLDTRGTHVGYYHNNSSINLFTNLNSNYWYGADYSYDSSNNVFTLSGTTEQAIWNNSTYQNLIGKYTCKSTSESGSCSTLYFIDSYYNTTNAYVIPLKRSSQFYNYGTIQFNIKKNSLTYGGYMYGDVYNSYSLTTEERFTKTQTVLASEYQNNNWWYGDDIIYDSNTGNYSLVNPVKYTDYKVLTGKYTFKNNSENYTNSKVYYVASVDDWSRKIQYIQISNGNLLSYYEPLFGDSITDNGNGTYSLNNVISSTLVNYSANYKDFKNLYICPNNTSSCTNPRYITYTSSVDYEYIDASERIMVSKSKQNLNLVDTLLVRKDELIINRDNYSDYKYTCNSVNSTCTNESLRMIKISLNGYTYLPNHYYGSSVTWNGSNYSLVDPKNMDDYNITEIKTTHHYFCLSLGTTTCSQVAYLYGSSDYNMNYIIIKDGVSSIEEVLNSMLKKNTNNSVIKNGIEAWYKHNMLDYDKYIEDTIYCNDRSIEQIGGWYDNGGELGGINSHLKFNGNDEIYDLNCINVEDQFSVFNNKAKLEYKVGLLTGPELNLKNDYNARGKEGNYWTSSPAYYSLSIFNKRVLAGYLSNTNVNEAEGLRPAISLKPGIEYSDGDGSMTNPYIVKTD